MTGRVFNMDMERARRRPFASPPSSRDGLARVFVMEPEAVTPLEPRRESWLLRTGRGLATAALYAVVRACPLSWFNREEK